MATLAELMEQRKLAKKETTEEVMEAPPLLLWPEQMKQVKKETEITVETESTPTSLTVQVTESITTTAEAEAEEEVEEIIEIEEEKAKAEDEEMDILGMPIEEHIYNDAMIATMDIIPRIRALNSLDDYCAENEMRLLKDALLANPEAVALMLPQDIGELVRTQRRIMKEEILGAVAKKAKRTPTKAAITDPTELRGLTEDDF